jgi:uncharacterized membrane protein
LLDRDHVVAALRQYGPVGALLAMFGAVYGAMSLLRHDHFGSRGWDLGIFDQAIWHYSRFEAPASTIRGFDNLLADHFHPIIALLAPLLWIWDDVRILLLAQVVLFLVSAVPVYALATRWFGRTAGLLWCAAYLLFWGVKGAIEFDIHEVAFAVPLIAFGLWFTLDRRWTAAALCVLALLLVKEDLSFLVVAWGVVFLGYRQWWLGGATMVAGVAWFEVVTRVVMPALDPGGPGFAYWSYSQFGPDAIASAKHVVTHPWSLVTVAVSPLAKVKTMVLLFAPFGLLTLLSWPAVVLSATLVAERMLSDNSWFWTTDRHYSATIAPILAIGAIDGLRRLRAWMRARERPTHWLVLVPAVAVAANLAITLAAADMPLRRLISPSTYSMSADDRAAAALVAQIPPDASVTTQSLLAPHLTHRQVIYELAPGLPATDVLAINPTKDHIGTDAQFAATVRGYRERGYRVAWRDGDWMILTRPGYALQRPGLVR